MQDRPEPSRILGIHSGALGDVILFAQLLSVLKPAGCAVALAAGGAKARLLRELAVVDEALDFETLPMHEVFDAHRPHLACGLPSRLGRCDYLISCFATGSEIAECRLTAMCDAKKSAFLPIRPGIGWDSHLLELWAGQLIAAGFASDHLRTEGAPPPHRGGDVMAIDLPHWSVPAGMRVEAAEAIIAAGADPGEGYVVAHVGSGSAEKRWPLAAFEALVDYLDRPVVFILGPVEMERLGESAIVGLRRRAAVLTKPTLACLAGILATARAFVGNDSGPAHLAAAVGTPTLSLFGPTNPVHFAPRGIHTRVIHRQLLADLRPRTVADALARMIDKDNSKGPRDVD
ncbi:MAG: hypothetical protein HQ546_09440 [Planctomycetes bacterium]|nr:hypothetical protein [Planctomycetota bacterium]